MCTYIKLKSNSSMESVEDEVKNSTWVSNYQFLIKKATSKL